MTGEPEEPCPRCGDMGCTNYSVGGESTPQAAAGPIEKLEAFKRQQQALGVDQHCCIPIIDEMLQIIRLHTPKSQSEAEAVEVMAAAMHDHEHNTEGTEPFDGIEESGKEYWRDSARTAYRALKEHLKKTGMGI